MQIAHATANEAPAERERIRPSSSIAFASTSAGSGGPAASPLPDGDSVLMSAFGGS